MDLSRVDHGGVDVVGKPIDLALDEWNVVAGDVAGRTYARLVLNRALRAYRRAPLIHR